MTLTPHGCWGGRSGQDLGDGIWPLLAALLPRTTKIQASTPCRPAPPPRRAPHVRAPAVQACAALSMRRRGEPRRGSSAKPQVSSRGAVEVVSGVGAKGTSKMALSGGGGLGAAGATRLAGLLREAPPLLASLDIRHACVSILVLYSIFDCTAGTSMPKSSGAVDSVLRLPWMWSSGMVCKGNNGPFNSYGTFDVVSDNSTTENSFLNKT